MAPRQWWNSVFRGLQLPSAGTAAGVPATNRRCARRTTADASITHRIRPPAGWPAAVPGGTAEAFGNRCPNKNPIRALRTGLGATTRLRQGELRFRRGQSANVHRSDVAGGGPFVTARCRDRFTHYLPQETSAGRNLITLFVHVNNPVQLFFTRPPLARAMRARRGGSMHRLVRAGSRAMHASSFHKLHKKRHLAKPLRNARDRLVPCRRMRRLLRSADFAFATRTKSVARQPPVFASHKSICAKTAQTSAACAAVQRPVSGTRVRMRGSRKNPRRRRRGFVCNG